MATKKITLNELRSIVKQIIKEEMVLKEALNKDIKQFGKDLGKYLTNAGFQVKYVDGTISNNDKNLIKQSDKKLVALEIMENQEAQALYLSFNPKDLSGIRNIVDKFQLSNYSGKVFNINDWGGRKQVSGALNPGDIYSAIGQADSGSIQFFRLAKVDTKVKNI